MARGPHFREEDVRRSYRWLGHGDGLTELVALHPAYRPGKTHAAWNRRHDAYPRTWYVNTEAEVVSFVQRYAQTRMVCYSLNPRTQPFLNRWGYLRGAREHEIEHAQNACFDLDLDGEVTPERLEGVMQLLDRTSEYFRDNSLAPPTTAFTGRGYHLLFAFPPINTRQHPDLRNCLRAFREQFADAYRESLARLEGRIDHTLDLRRVVKIYGTAKPQIGMLSRFYGGKRREDAALCEYLFRLSAQESREKPSEGLGGPLSIGHELPAWFPALLDTDPLLRDLWEGNGKPAATDVSRSGYDFSLIKRLAVLRHRNCHDLATLLVLRPEGAVQRSGKDERYIRRTIENALGGRLSGKREG